MQQRRSKSELFDLEANAIPESISATQAAIAPGILVNILSTISCIF